MALTSRWTPLRPHPVQLALWNSPCRFAVVPAGRRSGKTERAKRKLALAALNWRGAHHANFFAGAPTESQAKRIYWEDLKKLIPRIALAGRPNESEHRIDLLTDASIYVVGLDKPERIEGSPWDGGVLDEYGNMKADVWDLHVRPAMSDRMGWCWFIGVPEGRNHYYDMAEKARLDTTGTYELFTWTSSDILPAGEIAQARADLDDLSFAQEYEASFVSFQGRAYYAFDARRNVRAIDYDPTRPLIACFDFNTSPGICGLLQEDHAGAFTGMIDEIHIPRNSNTPLVCDRLIARYGAVHRGEIWCYGDATGGSGGTAKVLGSDWDLIRAHLRPVFGDRLRLKVGRSNPPERQRVNAVNARCCNATGDRRFFIDPRCRETIKDFEGVLVAPNGSIDKTRTPELTHLSDAIGYYLADRYPLVKGVLTNGGI